MARAAGAEAEEPMYRTARFAVMALLVCAATARAAQDPVASPSAQVPSIVTNGEATVRRAPDVAFVSIAVETRARTSKEAQQQNADAMTAVQQRIAKAGIARDAVRTTGYNIQQEFDFANGRRTPRGYVARSGVEVRLDGVERVGELLDALVDAGATTVAGIRFDLKDRAGAEREALRLAVADARARAEAIAAGAGRTIDRVIRITDAPQPRFRAPMPMAMERGLATAAATPETPIEAGTIEVHAQVELVAGFK
jgi:uncharacterized protein YggE